MGSFLESLPRNGQPRPIIADPGFRLDGAADSRALANYSGTGYATLSGGDQLVDVGAGKAGDEWSVVNAWCRENINK